MTALGRSAIRWHAWWLLRVVPPPSESLATPDMRTIVDGLHGDEAQALFGFVRRQGLTDEQADDAVQEVFARLLEQSRRGITITNPRAWAFQAIYRIAMDQHRIQRRLAKLLGSLRQRGPGDEVDATPDRLAVWHEVDRLPDRQRTVIYLRYRADLRFEEIGQTLGITASAARSHAAQAMATLRARLAGSIEDVP
jgi:RNA polymerase sigma-70 factor (ECF subfamily)